MSAIKRLVGSIRANFEWMVNQVENHEALVTSVIQEAQAAQARAKVQLAQVKRDGEKMRQRQHELQESVTVWTERAVKSAKLDEQKALECLRRKKQAETELNTLCTQLKEHLDLEAQLNRDLGVIEGRIDELKRKRNTLKTRESRAEALRAVHQDETGIMSDLESILERWEVKVTTNEICADVSNTPSDQFVNDFKVEEDTISLKAELDALLQSQSVNQ